MGTEAGDINPGVSRGQTRGQRCRREGKKNPFPVDKSVVDKPIYINIYSFVRDTRPVRSRVPSTRPCRRGMDTHARWSIKADRDGEEDKKIIEHNKNPIP